jgi:putative Mn2+ efflux pump MntP
MTPLPADRVDQFQRTALIAGAVAAVVSIAGAAVGAGAEQFFRSYLAAFMLWLGVALGSAARGAW